ncbi:hypothetical protein [Paenibacillus thermotolerans]|uniref:hypothetical protein n=1 Tax=Paenibacillus thermotolerans TaxID=3027807 RepID=UPI002368AE29|nr:MULTISPECIES: hypothetical protein [unclassified Paenibacillus]
MVHEFILLNVSFLLFVIISVALGEYKKSFVCFIVVLIINFYTPAVYYSVFNGVAYKMFSEQTYLHYLQMSSIIFLVSSIFLGCKYVIKFPNSEVFLKRPNLMASVYIMLITALVAFYILIFIKQMPLYSIVAKGISIDRPETSGSLPLYHTFSTFAFFILPGYLFYYLPEINSKLKKLVLFLLVTLVMVIGGNKGVMVFYFLFIWVFIYRLRINIKLAGMFSGAIGFYILISGSGGFIDSMLSAFRRFFVTQGVGMINRLEMISINYDFDMESISNSVFEFIYRYSGGSHPTFFLGDLLVKIGWLPAMMAFVIMLGLLVLISRWVDIRYGDNLFIQWNFFVVLYLIGMSGIGKDNLIRMAAIAINLLLILFLSNIRFRMKIFDNYKINYR